MKVINIGDLHLPYAKKSTINKAIKRVAEEQPDVVIQGGDLFDQYLFGRFDKNMNFATPEKELKKAREQAIEFWKNIKKAAPKARRIQLIGNHDVRLLKTCAKKYPEAYHIVEKEFKNLYKFNGVELKKSDRDYVKFDGVVYCHGWSSKHISHFKSSVVRQHDHKAWLFITPKTDLVEGAGITFKTTYTIDRSEHINFEISCGTFCDETKVPFGYVNSRRTNWQPAIAIVTKDYARLEIL